MQLLSCRWHPPSVPTRDWLPEEFIQILIDEIDLPIIVDAGIGRPSQACEAMEMGAAAIMANTALATAGDLPLMAAAFRKPSKPATGISGRPGPRADPGRIRIRSADRISAQLGGDGNGKSIFCRLLLSFPPKRWRKSTELETDPSSRKNHMEYLPGMEKIQSDVRDQVMAQVQSYDYGKYTARDVLAALEHETCSIEDFKALLSPAAAPFLEQMAQRARRETGKHFGNTVYLFTPLYIANYCENYCVYCGFNCYNHINRMKLSMEQIEKEMKVIADSGMEEILILTGESRSQSDVQYIGEACKLARKYFRMVGLEIYPVNTDEYRYLHECGADYVTVFQETYDADKV